MNALAEKPTQGRLPHEPIALPETDSEGAPFMVQFAERPVIQGPVGGNMTYLNQTPTPQGMVADFENDDA